MDHLAGRCPESITTKRVFSNSLGPAAGDDLTINGDVFFTGTVNIPIPPIGSNLHLTGNLEVDGTTDLYGPTTIDNTLTVTGASTLAGVSAETVIATAGLGSGGPTNLGAGLTVTGNTQLNGNLNVTGTITPAPVIGPNLDLTGTLTVGGVTTLNGATAINSTLNVTGTSTLAAVSATNVTASGTLGVTGVATFSNNVAVAGELEVTDSSTLGDLSAANGAFSGKLDVLGSTTLDAVSTIDAYVDGPLVVTGTSTLAAVGATNITASGTLGVTGASTLSGGTFTPNIVSATASTVHLLSSAPALAGSVLTLFPGRNVLQQSAVTGLANAASPEPYVIDKVDFGTSTNASAMVFNQTNWPFRIHGSGGSAGTVYSIGFNYDKYSSASNNFGTLYWYPNTWMELSLISGVVEAYITSSFAIQTGDMIAEIPPTDGYEFSTGVHSFIITQSRANGNAQMTIRGSGRFTVDVAGVVSSNIPFPRPWTSLPQLSWIDVNNVRCTLSCLTDPSNSSDPRNVSMISTGGPPATLILDIRNLPAGYALPQANDILFYEFQASAQFYVPATL